MSKQPFTDAKIAALVQEVMNADQNFVFLDSQKFWRKFDLQDEMQEWQAQAAASLAGVGVGVLYEASLGLLPDEQEELEAQGEEEGPEEAFEGGDEDATSAEDEGFFTPAELEGVVAAVAEAHAQEQLLVWNAEGFWAHFGLQDLMAPYQSQVTEKLNAAGLDISFDVIMELLPPELPMHMEFDLPPHRADLNLQADTIRALSIRQPWAELIMRGEKNLEYRSRRLREMGLLLIHASGTLDPQNFTGQDIDSQSLPFGALVGVVDVVGCVEVEGEEGLFAYQLAHPRRFRVPITYSGAAGIFRVPTDTVIPAFNSLV